MLFSAQAEIIPTVRFTVFEVIALLRSGGDNSTHSPKTDIMNSSSPLRRR